MHMMITVFFFFQAEDGIRSLYVTGVQTCALPIFVGDRTWAYRDLDAACSVLAGRLVHLGLVPGDRIGLHLPNSAEFVLAYYAAQKLGVVPLSLNVAYAPDEIAYIVGDATPKAI